MNFINFIKFLVRKNKNLILILTKYGGHVCWFKGILNPERVKFYSFKFNLIINI